MFTVKRRVAFAVTLLALPGLLMLEPMPTLAGAAPAGRPLPVSSPPLRLPEPSTPEGNAPQASAARRELSQAELAQHGPELVQRRDATTEVFANANGTQTMVLHSEPVNFEQAGRWEKIDNTLVADPARQGWLRNKANSWSVWFGPITPDGGGVELAGKIHLTPVIDSSQPIVLPVVGAGDGEASNVVTYAGVWPGVDLVYTITSSRVKESIVVHDGARAEFPFIVEGFDVKSASPGTGLARFAAPAAGGWELGALEVLDSSGRATSGSGVAASVSEAAKKGQLLTLSVDKAWLAGQAGGDRPVVIDPSFQLPATGNNWACSYLIFESLREESHCDGVRTGTHHVPGTTWGSDGRYWWRSVAKFDYRPYVEGKDLVSAQIWGNEYDELGLGYSPEIVDVWDAIAANAAGAVANGNRAYVSDEQMVPPDPNCYWGLEVCWDVTNTIGNWKFTGEMTGTWDNGMFGFSGDEADINGMLDHQSYKRFLPGDVKLALTVNTRPPAPPIVSPADGALAIDTLTPTLTWSTVDDPDGTPVTYTVKVATSSDGESGLVVSSPELAEPVGATQMSWTIPGAVLRDGITYYWKVVSHDFALDNGGGAFVSSTPRKLTVDRRFGLGGKSPSDEFGAVTTNLVTGNPSLTVAGPTMPSVGGGVSLGFVYNGRDLRYGLKATYRDDVDKDHIIEASDPIRLVRTDSEVSFEWGNGSPAPGVPTDYYTANYSGTVRMPSGKNWQFGVRSDDGFRLRYSGTTIIDSWNGLQANTLWETGSHPGGTTKAISLDYYEYVGPSYLQLSVREDLGGGAYGPAFIVPADWLSPEAPGLPSGWSLQAAEAIVSYTKATANEGSITLTTADGATFSFARTASGTYTPPPDLDDIVVANADGTISVHEDNGMDYTFGPDGGLQSVRTPRDDRRPAAARYSFDALGHLVAIDDPVSGRTTTLRYAASDADPNCPNSPPLGGTTYESEAGMVCRVSYWDGTKTDLYYFKDTDLLSHVNNPGEAWWGFSYDSQARLIGVVDPNARDEVFSGNRTDTDLNRLFTQIAYDPNTSGLKSRVLTVTLPAASQPDANRMSRTYNYAQNAPGGILVDGGASVTRGGMTGIFRSVKYDYRGRGIEETDPAGHTGKKYWDSRDLEYGNETSDGLLTATLYNAHHEPTDIFGPAPKSMFTKIWYGVDLWLPNDADCLSTTAAMTACDVGRTHTNYDEGIDGLQVKWWNATNAHGPVVAHAHDAGQLRESDSTGRPEGIAADNAFARYTGDITFPQAGAFKMQLCVGQWDAAWLWVDGRQVTQEWLPDTSAAVRCSDTANWPTWVTSGGAGDRHTIQVDYVDFGNPDLLHLNWIRPDGVYEAATGLTPAFGLKTSMLEPDGRKTSWQYTDAVTGIGPQHGLVTRTITDPGGLNLTSTTTYEAAGGTAGFLRALNKTKPGGDVTRTATTYYLADNQATPTTNEAEVRDNPCTTASDPANQGGRVKFSTAADPDGGGVLTPMVREFVYDATGRVVASRIGLDPWTCTSYDARGRAVETKYPVFGTQAARTVTNVYAVDTDGTGPKGPSPLLTSVSDGAGTVSTGTDLLGRTTLYRDAFGNTTTYAYDVAGREAGNNGPVGQVDLVYDNADRVTLVKRAGAVLANNFVYNGQSGRLESVTYPSGTGNGGNGTKGTFTYDTFGRTKKYSWTNVATGAVLTSDEVFPNAAGNIVGEIVDGTDHHAGNDYSYDTAGRLTDAYLPGRRVQYEFGTTTTTACGANTLTTAGANTNRTKQTVTPTGGTAVTTTYCYDRADRLTSTSDSVVGGSGYDAHGNTTAIFGETHEYDAADRHMSTTKAGTTVAYQRDATDRIVERRLNGATTARYGSTGPGDSPAFVTDAGNAVQEIHYTLPGGAMLTTRAGTASVWSYPNIHGDIAATADATGAKQGATSVYDPYGSLVSGSLPDNGRGNLDYGFLGQYKRPLEHEPALQPVIEMGARQYSPLLGRFLEVDPVDGGSANAYEYVNGDPVNNQDLAGTNCYPLRWLYGSRRFICWLWKCMSCRVVCGLIWCWSYYTIRCYRR